MPVSSLSSFQTSSNIIFPMRTFLNIPLRKYKEPEENSHKLSPPRLPATGTMYTIWSSANMNELGPSEDQPLHRCSTSYHLLDTPPQVFSTSSIFLCWISQYLNLPSRKSSNNLYLKSPLDPTPSCLLEQFLRELSILVVVSSSSFPFYSLSIHSYQAFPHQSTKTVFDTAIPPLLNPMVTSSPQLTWPSLQHLPQFITPSWKLSSAVF